MTRLRGLVEYRRITVDPGFMPETVDHYSIPALDAMGGPERTSPETIDSQKLALRGGEILLSRLNPRKSRVHLLPERLDVFSVASTEFVVMQPVRIDPRYARYLLLSEATRQDLDSQVRSATRSHQRVEHSAVLAIDCPIGDKAEQRRIADFLDDRVARIDQIIAARSSQEALVRENQVAAVDALIRDSGSVIRPLQSLTDPRRPIQYGIVLPGPDFPGGVSIIKGGDIASGRLSRLELNCTDPEIERGYVRSRVRPGDLVIAIRGSVGEIDEVPPSLSLANLTQDSARIAPYQCDPQWLRVVLMSPAVQAAMASAITGAMVKGINIEDLRRVPVPVPDESAQREIARAGLEVRQSGDAHRAALQNSIALLTEYKQALITAAVTGELDVTTAGSGIPG